MDANELRVKLANHAKWLEDNSTGERADLREADLREADLSGANLRWADLRWADLRGADLSGADLSGANLSGANLREANLSEANLRWADLRGADLIEADLRWVDLRGADLSRADLRGADLRWAEPRKVNQVKPEAVQHVPLAAIYDLVCALSAACAYALARDNSANIEVIGNNLHELLSALLEYQPEPDVKRHFQNELKNFDQGREIW